MKLCDNCAAPIRDGERFKTLCVKAENPTEPVCTEYLDLCGPCKDKYKAAQTALAKAFRKITSRDCPKADKPATSASALDAAIAATSNGYRSAAEEAEHLERGQRRHDEDR